ncbi:MAG: response regulator transcription factor [Deltaproteobacteria bacterium]|nr:response regulator transcription factor [Deltaproteobacteria bacterium]
MTTNQTGHLVLVAEDDPKTANLIALYLGKEGHQAVVAPDGQAALELFQQAAPSLIILDLMLPRLDGWQVAQAVRAANATPIIMLTARGEEEDRVRGLNLGADDYVVKPFSPRELMARVRAVLRRTAPGDSAAAAVLTHRGLLLDLDKRTVKLDGQLLSLTPHEYKLLAALLAAPGKVFRRDELLDRLYPAGEAVVDRVVDVHIGKLRQKLEADPADPRFILTVRGMGYRFADRGE